MANRQYIFDIKSPVTYVQNRLAPMMRQYQSAVVQLQQKGVPQQATSQQQARPEPRRIELPSQSASVSPAAKSPISVGDELKKLIELRDAGELSEEEFLQQKQRLLS